MFLREGEDIRDYLYDIWNTMKQSVSDGLTRTGELPGGLEVERKAQYLYNRRHIDESPQTRENRLVCAYAFAVAEQNASGGEIVNQNVLLASVAAADTLLDDVDLIFRNAAHPADDAAHMVRHLRGAVEHQTPALDVRIADVRRERRYARGAPLYAGGARLLR